MIHFEYVRDNLTVVFKGSTRIGKIEKLRYEEGFGLYMGLNKKLICKRSSLDECKNFVKQHYK